MEKPLVARTSGMCSESYHLFHALGVTRVGVEVTKRIPSCFFDDIMRKWFEGSVE